MTDNNDEIQRTAGGQIVAGSGAQLGKNSTRRRGTGEAAKLRRQIAPLRENLVDQLHKIAQGNDSAAVRAASELLSLLSAKPKPQSELVSIPEMKEAVTPEAKAEAVLAALASGKVSAEAARAVLQTIDAAVRIKKYTELEARISALERARGLRPAPIDITPEPEVPLV
jgi:hypothetical protein